MVVEMLDGWLNGHLPADGSPDVQDTPQDTATEPMVIKSGSSLSASSNATTVADTNGSSQESIPSRIELNNNAVSADSPTLLRCFGMGDQIDDFLMDAYNE